MNWIIAKKISLVFIFALLLALIADVLVFTLVEYGRKGSNFIGCYAYDAMLIGFECQGFMGSAFVAAWLNWPLWLVFSPMFAVFSFKVFVVALLVWLPLTVYLVSMFKLRKQGNA